MMFLIIKEFFIKNGRRRRQRKTELMANILKESLQPASVLLNNKAADLSSTRALVQDKQHLELIDTN